MGPQDVCKFLILKDVSGQTPIHHVSCRAINDRHPKCLSPRKLAVGTVTSIVGQLQPVFETQGLGLTWCDVTGKGNPIASKMVTTYLKAIREEQSRAHVTYS